MGNGHGRCLESASPVASLDSPLSAQREAGDESYLINVSSADAAD